MVFRPPRRAISTIDLFRQDSYYKVLSILNPYECILLFSIEAI